MFDPISNEAAARVRALAGSPADKYVQELLLPALKGVTGAPSATEDAVRAELASPYGSLLAAYGYYAFSRRGKDRHELASVAIAALRQTCDPETIEDFLKEKNAARLWQGFLHVSKARKRKPMEQLNMGVVAGLAELAQDIYRQDGVGSICEWIAEGVCQSGRIEPQFNRMVDVRGIGPKLTSLLLRDVVYVFNLEQKIDPVDRLYYQPVDKFSRLLAPYLIEEQGIEEAADWVLAGKLSKYARRAGVSGVCFNMGTTYFGMKLAKDASVDAALEQLLNA